MDTDIRVLRLEPRFRDEKFRTPLKFGSGIISSITSFTVRAEVENKRGEIAEGWGNILLSVVWAFPSAVLSFEERDRAMRQVSQRFCEFMEKDQRFDHPIDKYLRVKENLIRIAQEVSKEMNLKEPMPVLGALTCGSPLDAALHDAFGRVNGICSYDGYGPQFMDHDLSLYLGEGFRGKYISDYLRKEYTPQLPIFHLVGGVDKPTRDEVTGEDPQDGLPVSLDQWIERDGIFCFKVKLKGNDIDWDVRRTKAVAEVAAEALQGRGRKDFYLSIDSNEMHESPENVIEYLKRLKRASPMAFRSLLYIEQPTERELSAHRFKMHELAKMKPVLADEGVTDLDKFGLARELGWSGIALKTCKGHSSALLYVAMSEEYNMPHTVQDLTNPGLSLVHSAGLAARIHPLKGFEYNSRQYLPHVDEEVRRKHKELFIVRDGVVRTASLSPVGLGY